MTSWKLPLIVAAIAVPIAVAFLFAGPAVGVAAGALAGVAIIAVAAQQRPRGTIGPPPSSDVQRLLVVLAERLEDPRAVEQVARIAHAGGGAGGEVVVLAPARIRFLDRWASDVEGARHEAQQRLVVSVAALTTAGVEAEARVGDEDVVQAVEDQLGSFPASEVVLVSDGDEAAAQAARELEARLRAGFHHVVTGPAAR
ncbi:MAG TPA: hypothetical protein VFJ61_10585 [Solirubrobacterales bacterium]|nr:hypothetical protein [Solirubrobacterales bacterium]